jgi:hypothetical protein
MYGVNLADWSSNRSQYLKDAYPVFAFLAVWLDEAGLEAYFHKELKLGSLTMD